MVEVRGFKMPTVMKSKVRIARIIREQEYDVRLLILSEGRGERQGRDAKDPEQK